MNITKDDVLNHLRESFNVKNRTSLERDYDSWERAEQAEYTYFTQPDYDGVIRDSMGHEVELDSTLSDAGVTWRYITTTSRSIDSNNDDRFSRVTEFTLPSGENFIVAASFISDSWDSGSQYYVTSESISEAQRREKIVHYYE